MKYHVLLSMRWILPRNYVHSSGKSLLRGLHWRIRHLDVLELVLANGSNSVDV